MNIVIIGAGPAGEAAAKKIRQLSGAASKDHHITIVEREQAGGTCLNKGCIPSKTILNQIQGFAERGQKVDWAKIQTVKNQVVTDIRSQLESSLKKLNINLFYGTARFASPASIQVDTASGPQILPFDKALIATGSDIFYPPPLDQFKNELFNSDKMLNLDHTPSSIVIVGGGAVGLEFACLLNAAGTKVTIVELQDGILPGEDPAIVTALTKSFEDRGIIVKTGAIVTSITRAPAPVVIPAKAGIQDFKKKLKNRFKAWIPAFAGMTENGWELTLNSGEKLEAEYLLSSVGRLPNPSKLDLEKAGIKTEKNRMITNEYLQTTNPNVFSAGDVTTTRLAHAAAAQAEVAAENLLGDKHKFDASLTPRCLYSWPEVASVGGYKHQLDEKGLTTKTARAFFKGSSKALALGETEGFVQILSNAANKKILGAQIIGAQATELIHIFAVAIKAGMTTTQLGEVMFAHPTLSELIKEAAKKS